jgi:hypothetical protein
MNVPTVFDEVYTGIVLYNEKNETGGQIDAF